MARYDHLPIYRAAFDLAVHLEQIVASLREKHGIEHTLQEQLERAVADEDYEKAARLRDKLKRRQ